MHNFRCPARLQPPAHPSVHAQLSLPCSPFSLGTCTSSAALAQSSARSPLISTCTASAALLTAPCCGAFRLLPIARLPLPCSSLLPPSAHAACPLSSSQHMHNPDLEPAHGFRFALVLLSFLSHSCCSPFSLLPPSSHAASSPSPPLVPLNSSPPRQIPLEPAPSTCTASIALLPRSLLLTPQVHAQLSLPCTPFSLGTCTSSAGLLSLQHAPPLAHAQLPLPCSPHSSMLLLF
jgi:hypothetical protein